jgi:8-oxo-dGTP pyrophosphatase MutT (NUDIX family)
VGFLDTVRRAFRSDPATVRESMADAGMDHSTSFGPGTPIEPLAGIGVTPRSRDFRAGVNTTSRPRTNERVSFGTLKGLIDSYDVAQLAIAHRIDDVRSLDISLKPLDHFAGDATEHLAAARKFLAKPDGVLPFRAWLAKYLEDVLRYDAGTLYRVRNRRRDVIGLKVVDGTTIAPLLDTYGNQPAPPAPAYVQYAQGVAWDWLDADDLVYVPFRPQPSSPYGKAPIESVLLNANTDLRFQSFLLRRFTEGTVPEGFAGAPTDWTPQQIADFQEAWDDLLYGDESAKHQIKWVPNGTTFTWSQDHPFDEALAKLLERKTLAAFSITPADMGITDDVNRATGETQADVQFRIGTKPLANHVEDILNAVLQDDLHLPVEMSFDTGQEKEDRLATAQADQIYVNVGAISPDEVRERVYGLPTDSARPVGRFVFGTRTGPVPLAAIVAVAGPIDPQTYGPAEDAELPKQVFAPIEGVAPAKPPAQPPLAVERFGDVAAPGGDVAAVTKAETEGVTSDTGITGVDLVGDGPDDLIPDADVVKAEMAAFRRFAKTRRKAGQWRDFTFAAVPAVSAHRLNDAGRAQVAKATGGLVAAGLCVRAESTGRVLMLQRAFDEADEAAGMFEFPGGHIETGESPLGAAKREWQEETGLLLPEGNVSGSWASPNGVYAGYVYTIADEALCPILDRDQVSNPDDPDGDLIESLAWWTPEHLTGNPAIRSELAADVGLVLEALGSELAKAGKRGDPKAGDPRWHSAPARRVEGKAVAHHAAAVRTALTSTLPRERLASLVSDYLDERASP